MKIYFDTEFTGLHKNTTLISIGLISCDNKQLYLEFTDYDKSQCNKWIQDNVLANLYTKQDVLSFVSYKNNTYNKGNKQENVEVLKNWLDQFKEDIQLISDCSHYDMILFIDLFGSAFDLPNYLSPVCHDINQDIACYFNITDYEAFNLNRENMLQDYGVEIKNITKHNSLYDAQVIKNIYDIIKTVPQV